MTKYLITGGTGDFGLVLTRRIRRFLDDNDESIHEVRTLSRHPAARRNAGPIAFLGDVSTGLSVPEAVSGVDVVVHLASGGMRPGARYLEVEGTRRMLEAARGVGARFVYLSIVGVDRHRLPYYQAKLEAEKLIEAWPGDWIIQRATQFHPFLESLMRRNVLIAPDPMRIQPIDAAEVADRIVEAVETGATGRLEDMGGPEVLRLDEVCTVWRDETGESSPRLVTVPTVGGALTDFSAGVQLSPDHAVGELTWRKWLKRQAKIKLPHLRDSRYSIAASDRAQAIERAKDKVAMEAMQRAKDAATLEGMARNRATADSGSDASAGEI